MCGQMSEDMEQVGHIRTHNAHYSLLEQLCGVRKRLVLQKMAYWGGWLHSLRFSNSSNLQLCGGKKRMSSEECMFVLQDMEEQGCGDVIIEKRGHYLINYLINSLINSLINYLINYFIN